MDVESASVTHIAGLVLMVILQSLQLAQTILTRRDVKRSIRPPPPSYYGFPTLEETRAATRKRRQTPRERPGGASSNDEHDE